MTNTQSVYQTERSFDISLTKRAISELLHTKNYQPSHKYTNNRFQVSFAELKTANTNAEIISGGSGKGIYHEVGALAEAIEHLYLQNFDRSSTPKRLSLRQVSDQTPFVKDRILKSLVKTRNEGVQVCSFNGLDEGTHWVPTTYVNPFFVSRSHLSSSETILRKYSSNMGTSFGLSFEDSFLHGLNESIERHYLSLFLLDLLQSRRSVDWFRCGSVSNNYRYKINSIESQFSGEVLIIAVRTAFGPFFSIAILLDENRSAYPIHQVGSGCSLNFESAITRSIDELAQSLVLYSEEERHEDLSARESLSEYKNLGKVLVFDKEDLSELCTKQKTYVSASSEESTREQIRFICAKLEAQGYQPLRRIVADFGHLGTIVQAFVPGLERFHLIRSGNLVAPQQEIGTTEND